MKFPQLPPDWSNLLKHELTQDYFIQLSSFVQTAHKTSVIYPPLHLIFQAFELCPLHSVKVVLIGQDPYHGANQANGLSFSVNTGQKKPPSLQNIFKELQSDLPGCEIPDSGNLENWAKQGVLLLNAVLSVEQSKPGSHKAFGWENFTNAVIHSLSESKEHLVFLLWGNYAMSKKELIDETKHLVLCAAHPSPLARGAFFGSKPFSKTNNYLKLKGLKEIDWNLNTRLKLNFD